MPARFAPNPGAVAEILNGPAAGEAIETVAAIAQQAIKSASPSRTYTPTILAPEPVRAALGMSARIATTSSIWHILEYGSAKNPPYRVFANGVQRAGLDYEAR